MREIILKDIRVSVIICFYKAEKYFKRCLESVLSQSEPEIEVILVNDGSPDNCGKIADEYAKRDSRIKVIHKTNGGVASARNAGLKVLRGKYVTFVDSDDWIDSDFIKVLLDKSIELDSDIVRCNMCYEYEDGTSKIAEKDFPDDSFIEKDDFKHDVYNKMISGIQMNSVWRTLFKKEILQGLEFDESLKTAEDLLFAMQTYTNAKSFAYVDLPLYHYFQSSGGLTGIGLSIITKYKCNFMISKLLIKYLKIWGMDTAGNKFLVYKRLLNITFSKVTRIMKSYHDIQG